MSENSINKKYYPLIAFAGVAAIIIISILTGHRAGAMNFLKSASFLIGGLSILVIIHEFGHYAAAKAFGMRVEKFYLFFDAYDITIWKFKRGETEYGIGWLPLGGYVKIAGLVDENMDTDFLQSEPQPWEFRAKPAWQRLIVMIGGVVMNVILGIIILSMMKFSYGDRHILMTDVKNGIEVTDSVPIKKEVEGKMVISKLPTIGHVMGFQTGDELVSFKGNALPYFDDYMKPNLLLKSGGYYEVKRNGNPIKIEVPRDAMNKIQSEEVIPDLFSVNVPAIISTDSTMPAFLAGLRDNDKITALNGKPIAMYADILQFMRTKKANDSVAVTYQRGETAATTVSLVLNKDGRMGVGKNIDLIQKMQKEVKYGFFESFVPGATAAFGILADNLSGFGKMFSGDLNARKSMAGVVGMGQVYGKAVEGNGMKGFWMITGLLSMMLAFMNIFPLPLPVLDGGHVIFILWEMITGKPVSMKLFFKAQQVGLVLVLGLMIFTNLNDILKLFGI